MEYRRLGQAGVRISEIALGNWITHGGSISDQQAAACTRTALDLGINYFDTADVYAGGRAEEVLGKALAEVPRKDVVIASKVFFATGRGPNDRGLSRKHIVESCSASLKRLGTDYLDFYYCHRYDEDTPLEEVVRAMDDLIHQGKVLYWGFSQWSAEQIDAGVNLARKYNLYPPQVSQPEYSMVVRHVETGPLQACERHGIGVCVWSPLAQGVLTGKYSEGNTPKDSRATNEADRDFMSRFLTPEIIEKVDRLLPIARELNLTMAQLALAWCLRKESLTSVIIGASRPEQVKENAAASGVKIPAEVLEKIDEIFE